MMDYLTIVQKTTNVTFHHQTMLKYVSTSIAFRVVLVQHPNITINMRDTATPPVRIL